MKRIILISFFLQITCNIYSQTTSYSSIIKEVEGKGFEKQVETELIYTNKIREDDNWITLELTQSEPIIIIIENIDGNKNSLVPQIFDNYQKNQEWTHKVINTYPDRSLIAYSFVPKYANTTKYKIEFAYYNKDKQNILKNSFNVWVGLKSTKSNDDLDLLLEKAENKDVSSMLLLAEKYEKGDEIVKNEKAAFNWYSKAALQRDEQALFKTGLCYHKGIGTEINYSMAYYYYKLASDQGNVDAMNNIGSLYFNKLFGEEKNYEKTLEWIQKAANNGSAEAMNSLGNFYYNGGGLPKNLELAKYWYNKSCNLGYKKACANYKDMD
jgi:hypothetical protein